MHNANLENSPRLQRVFSALSLYGEMSTLELCKAASTCNAGTCASELRHNDIEVKCTQRGKLFFYRLGW